MARARSLGADLLPLEEAVCGIGVSELPRLKKPEDENNSLRKLVVDLSLDKHILQEIVSI